MSKRRTPAPLVYRTKTVVALTGLSATTLWRLTRRGKFPKPVWADNRRRELLNLRLRRPSAVGRPRKFKT